VGPLIGFVSIPRPAESLRPAGAFFSAVVEAKAGPQTFRVRLDGKATLVTTDLDLVPGQTLRLKVAAQEKGRLVLQVVSPAPAATVGSGADPALMAAFVARGLPLAAERLTAWTRWLGRAPGVSDKEGWAASLEARGEKPAGPLADALEPWLTWQSSLEEGRSQAPPDDKGFWDLWNSRKPVGGDPWLVMPLRWEYQGVAEAGLLQAHWSPQAQAVDRWQLTAAPAGAAFRLEARTKPGSLDLTWHFFDPADAARWKPLEVPLAAACTQADLKVTLAVQGRPSAEPSGLEGVDVRA